MWPWNTARRRSGCSALGRMTKNIYPITLRDRGNYMHVANEAALPWSAERNTMFLPFFSVSVYLLIIINNKL